MSQPNRTKPSSPAHSPQSRTNARRNNQISQGALNFAHALALEMNWAWDRDHEELLREAFGFCPLREWTPEQKLRALGKEPCKYLRSTDGDCLVCGENHFDVLASLRG